MDSNPKEEHYYERQSKLEGFGEEAQKLLKKAKIGIVGVGGLGCPLAEVLASSGVGSIRLIDFDSVEMSNLHRQNLFGTEDIGLKKTIAAQARLTLRNPFVKIETVQKSLNKSNRSELLAELDIVVDATDNTDSRFLISDYCSSHGLQCISGALFGWESTVFNFDPNSPKQTNYRDLYPSGIKTEAVMTCAETGTLPLLCNITAMKMASICLFSILKKQGKLQDKFLHFDLRKDKWTSFNINPNNSNPHRNKEEITQDAVSFEELDKLNANQGFEVIDVRTTSEYEKQNTGYRNIPLEDLSHFIEDLREVRPVFLCNTGRRSSSALSLFKKSYPDKKAFHLMHGLKEKRH